MAHGLRRTAFDQSSYAYWTGKYGVVNVKDYGAVGDGAHDDTQAIQAAIEAAAHNGGGVVWFPIGNYVISSALTITTGAIMLQGNGIGIGNGSTLQLRANEDVIRVVNPSFRVIIRDLEISNATGFTPSMGWAIKVEDCQQTLIENVYIFNLYNGIGDFGASTVTCHQVHMESLAGPYGFYMTGNSSSNPANVLDCVSCHVTSCANAQAYTIDNYANTLRLRGCASNANLKGLVTQNTSGNSANAPAIIIAQDLEIDHNTSDAVYLNAGSDVQIVNLWISSCAGHGIHTTANFGSQLAILNGLIEFNGGDGIHLDGGQQIQVSQCNINGNQNNGVFINTSGHVQATQLLVFNNSQASLNNYQGIQITGGTSNVAITHSRVGAINGASNSQGTNILIQGGSGNNILIINVDVRGAAYYNILNQSTGSNVVILHNPGYDGIQSVAGATAGTVYYNESRQNSSKHVLFYFDSYENDTTTNQTIDFPNGFTYTPAVSTNTTGLTLSASATSLTITSPDSTSTYSGVVEVVGI